MPDELLSSYLYRVAQGMDLKPITFLNAVWGSGKSLLNQDLDNYAPDHVVRRIANGIGCDPNAVIKSTLAAYAGTLFVNHNFKGRNPWLLPTTVKSNDRRRGGLQFCPACLINDEVPYFRRKWRLAFVTTCTTHGIMLRDRCPNCEQVVHQHRAPGQRHCYSCGSSLCQGPFEASDANPIRHDFIDWQRGLEHSLITGWFQLPDEVVHSITIFAIVRQIAALLVNGPKSTAFRSATSRILGGDGTTFEKPTRRQPFEYLDVAARHRLFDMVQRLMMGWPVNFVVICQEAGLHRSHAIKDMRNPPFAFDSVMRGYLDHTPYYSTDEEVAAAAAWLRRTTGRVTYAALKALCGENRSAICRHMDYVRQPAKPSKYREKALAT